MTTDTYAVAVGVDHTLRIGVMRIMQMAPCRGDIAEVRDLIRQPVRELPGARFGGVRMGSAARPETKKPTPGVAGASARTSASTCTDRDPPGSPPRSCPPQCRAGERLRTGVNE
jgi:hypothetical protein